MPKNRLFWFAVLFVFLLSQIVYIWTLVPDIDWGDSPELTTTAYTLGIAHPTGYSFYTLLTHLFTRMGQVQSVAWRVNYFSAFSSSLAMVLLFLLIYRYLLVFLTEEKSKVYLALSGTFLFAFSTTVWAQSVKAEVYSFELLIIITILILFFEWFTSKAPRYLYAGFFLLGIGFTHHLLTVVLLPVVALLLLFNKENRELFQRKLFLLISLSLLGFLCVLYLPIRSAHHPVMNWGNVQSSTNLLDVVSGGQFKLRMVSTQPGLGMQNSRAYTGLMETDILKFFNSVSLQFVPGENQLGIFSVWLKIILLFLMGSLSLVGIVTLYQYAKYLLFSSLAIFLMIMLVITNYHIIDIDSYYIPALLMIILWFVSGFGRILITMSVFFSRNRLIQGLIFFLVGCIGFFTNYTEILQTQNKSAYYYGKNILSSVEDNALILTGGDNDIFPLWYWKYVHGFKPGVTVFGANFLTSPWYMNYFQNDKSGFSFVAANGLYRSQEEWAGALIQKIISPYESQRPVYSTFYDPFLAKERNLINTGSYLPDNIVLPDSWLLPQGQLFQIKLQQPEFSVQDKNAAYPLNAVFDNTLALVDLKFENSNQVHPGDIARVNLYWKVNQKTNKNYSVLIVYPDEKGLLQTKNEKPLFAQEFIPVHNVFVTSQWTPGTVYKESYNWGIPLFLSPGKYNVAVSVRGSNGFVEGTKSVGAAPEKALICGSFEVTN